LASIFNDGRYRESVVGWRSKQTTREQAVAEIARRYHEFVDIFEKARAA